jgi:hypothetical protein
MDAQAQLDPDDPPTKDPRRTGIMKTGQPGDRGPRAWRECPVCKTTTIQDEYTIVVSAWFGVHIPFGKTSTKGKLGTRATFWCCTRCAGAFSGDDAARAFCEKTWGDPVGAVPTRRNP